MVLKMHAIASLVLVAFLSVGSALGSSVGIAKAKGRFSVDGATVYGNSTIFDGSAVETGMVAVEFQLTDGARLQLAPNSRSTVYSDRVMLEKGTAQLKGGGNYPIEARTLRIVQAGQDDTVQVTIGKTNQVLVAALVGDVQVTNAQGLVVANLEPERALELSPQWPAPPTQVTGLLQEKNGRFILTDEITNVTVELQGVGLDKEVGNDLTVTGAAIPSATPVAGSTQVIRVHETAGAYLLASRTVNTEMANSALPSAAPQLSIPGASAAFPTGAKVAIVGGVAVAITAFVLKITGVIGAKAITPLSP